jgi:cytochrome c oxidase subunit 2
MTHASSGGRRLFLALPALLPFALAAIAQPTERVVKLTCRKFEYEPKEVTLKVGEPVVLELSSIDVTHGFVATQLRLEATVVPDKPVRLRFVPDRVGTFEFHCDNFCGDGHEDMEGQFLVVA